jgi:predicted enzyme related to lactoylglutathione lyase
VKEPAVPRREEAPIGAPCWVDLFTSDPERSQAFYNELFGWTCENAGEEYGGYFNFSKDGVQVAGGMRNDGDAGTPDAWSIYLATADAAATVDAAAARGSAVIVPAMPVMELGSMAVVTDPGGDTIGIWQPGLHKGFGVFGEPGTPAWFELHSRAYDAAVEFYRDVFEWDARPVDPVVDAPEFRYTTLNEGDTQLAGIMDASSFPADAPSGWSIYFGTDDADKSLARIADLGGKVVQPAEDTPYGRLAQAADPTGALFKLVQGM